MSYPSYPPHSSDTTGEADFSLYSSTYPEQYDTIYTTAPGYQQYTPTASFDSLSAHPAHSYDKSLLTTKNSSYSPAMSSFDPHAPFPSSTSDSGASGPSTLSSAVASPSLSGQNAIDWQRGQAPMGINIVQHHDAYTGDSSFDGFDTGSFADQEKLPGCVDPALIGTYPNTAFAQSYATGPMPSPGQGYIQPGSPAPSQGSMTHNMIGPIRSNASAAPVWHPYAREQSVGSVHSHQSPHSSGSSDSDENKVICPIPSCGRPIRDLKAHMLTHQSERPEKCPIPSCAYHVKGFARKYDKNRHTLTHYKGTMVCDFCPGSGSSSEKSFNRTDVFKRHLQSVHGVEQTTPNSRRRKTTASGKKNAPREVPGTCRTCGVTFASAQELHDHIDDCVLRVVQRTEPSESINEQLLTSVAGDEDVKQTLAKHNLPTSLEGPTSFSDDDIDAEDDSTNSH